MQFKTNQSMQTQPEKLLTRNEFRAACLERDKELCVITGEKATDVHHIMERRLFSDEGYYKSNGVSLSHEAHLAAERTLISCEELREKAGITNLILPDHLTPDQKYDKWGNPFLNQNTRLRGELFYEEPVQKILESAGVLGDFTTRTKYPKTLHLPFSPGLQNDDRLLPNDKGLQGEEIIAGLKLDGECTSLTREYMHARSLDSTNHPSRNWVKALHGQIAHEIPEDMTICGENCFAEHSIHYDNLPSYFLVFNIWEKGRRLAWDETLAYCDMLGLTTVPILYRGIWDPKKIEELCSTLDPKTQEGLVIQVTRSISAPEWKKTSAKFVRKGHVQTDQFWRSKPIVPNGLAKNPEEVSFLGREPTPPKPSKSKEINIEP